MSDKSNIPKPKFEVVAERIVATCDRIEKKFDLIEANMDERFDRLEAKMNRAFDRLESKLEAGFDRMDSKFDIVEWKLARLEYTLAGATLLFLVLLAIGFRWI